MKVRAPIIYAHLLASYVVGCAMLVFMLLHHGGSGRAAAIAAVWAIFCPVWMPVGPAAGIVYEVLHRRPPAVLYCVCLGVYGAVGLVAYRWRLGSSATRLS